MFHMIVLEQTFVNALLQNFFLLLLLNRIDSILLIIWLSSSYALYVLAAVFPPWPVQLVWKNCPLGLSSRS